MLSSVAFPINRLSDGQAAMVDASLNLSDYFDEYESGVESYESTIHNLKLLLLPVAARIPEANLAWEMDRDNFEKRLADLRAMLGLKNFISFLRTPHPLDESKAELRVIANNSLIIKAGLTDRIDALLEIDNEDQFNLAYMQLSLPITSAVNGDLENRDSGIFDLADEIVQRLRLQEIKIN